MRIEKNLNQPSAERINNLTQGRPLMVGPVIDEKVRKFLVALFRKGGDIGKEFHQQPQMFYSA